MKSDAAKEPPLPWYSRLASGAPAFLFAVVGIVLDVTTEEPKKIIPAAVVGLGLVAAAAVVTPTRYARWLSGSLAVVLIAFGLLYLWPFSDRLAKPGPAPNAPVTRVAPPPGLTDPIKGCVRLAFTGDPPKGWAFAIATNTDADKLLYWQGKVVKDAGTQQWQALIALGTSDVGKGMLYHVRIVLLDKEWADYLTLTRAEDDATWWTSSTLPPNARQVDTFDLQRNNDSDLGC